MLDATAAPSALATSSRFAPDIAAPSLASFRTLMAFGGGHAERDDVVEALREHLGRLLRAAIGEGLHLVGELLELVGRQSGLGDELRHRGLEVGGHLGRGDADADDGQRDVGRERPAGARHALADALEVRRRRPASRRTRRRRA